MTEKHRPIFRSDAIRRYAEGREKAVLPRVVTPRTFLYLWLLVGLLIVSGFMAWLAYAGMI